MIYKIDDIHPCRDADRVDTIFVPRTTWFLVRHVCDPCSLDQSSYVFLGMPFFSSAPTVRRLTAATGN